MYNCSNFSTVVFERLLTLFTIKLHCILNIYFKSSQKFFSHYLLWSSSVLLIYNMYINIYIYLVTTYLLLLFLAFAIRLYAII